MRLVYILKHERSELNSVLNAANYVICSKYWKWNNSTSAHWFYLASHRPKS